MSLETILNFPQHKAILVTERNVWFNISGRDGWGKIQFTYSSSVHIFWAAGMCCVFHFFMPASNIRSISQRVNTVANKSLVVIFGDSVQS